MGFNNRATVIKAHYGPVGEGRPRGRQMRSVGSCCCMAAAVCVGKEGGYVRGVCGWLLLLAAGPLCCTPVTRVSRAGHIPSYSLLFPLIPFFNGCQERSGRLGEHPVGAGGDPGHFLAF